MENYNMYYADAAHSLIRDKWTVNYPFLPLGWLRAEWTAEVRAVLEQRVKARRFLMEGH